MKITLDLPAPLPELGEPVWSFKLIDGRKRKVVEGRVKKIIRKRDRKTAVVEVA